MNENTTTDTYESDIVRTSERVKVEWRGGLGEHQTVEVNPYSGKITVNGRSFAIGSLCSQDVPDWMYRSSPTNTDQSESDE